MGSIRETQLPLGGDLLSLVCAEINWLSANSRAGVSAPVGDFYPVPLLDDAPKEWLDEWTRNIEEAVDDFRAVDGSRTDELVAFPVGDVTVMQPSFRFDALDYYLGKEGVVVEVTVGAGFSSSGSLPVVLLVGGRVVVLDGTHRFLAAVTAGRHTFSAVPLSVPGRASATLSSSA